MQHLDSRFRIQEVYCPVYVGNTAVASSSEILPVCHSLHTSEVKGKSISIKKNTK